MIKVLSLSETITQDPLQDFGLSGFEPFTFEKVKGSATQAQLVLETSYDSGEESIECGELKSRKGFDHFPKHRRDIHLGPEIAGDLPCLLFTQTPFCQLGEDGIGKLTRCFAGKSQSDHALGLHSFHSDLSDDTVAKLIGFP